MTDAKFIISVHEAATAVAERHAVVLDVSFELGRPGQASNESGKRKYLAGHIPGARYVHLEDALSDMQRCATEGRHPLPSPASFAHAMREAGVRTDRPVLVYDQQNSMFAARLWWLLRASGKQDVAVIDGGFAAWLQAELPISTAPEPITSGDFEATDFSHMPRFPMTSIARELESGTILLVDARAAPRFAGREEPLDPVAGHIPGAHNRPFNDNLQANGCFKSRLELRREWQAILAGRSSGTTVQMCGSGVTACHNILAMSHAGLGDCPLFAESWSGWITDPLRPVVRDAP